MRLELPKKLLVLWDERFDFFTRPPPTFTHKYERTYVNFEPWSESRGLSNDAEHLSWIIFSSHKQALWLLFLAYSSFDNCI